jgi:L-rhamnose mutarotase
MAMVRFGQLGKLKKDKIEEYIELHAATWPGVLKTITECNLQNYSIFIEDDVVFGYYEYTGSDYEADMAKMAADPLNKEWWGHTRPCFTKYHADKPEAFYTDMQQIFYLE